MKKVLIFMILMVGVVATSFDIKPGTKVLKHIEVTSQDSTLVKFNDSLDKLNTYVNEKR